MHASGGAEEIGDTLVLGTAAGLAWVDRHAADGVGYEEGLGGFRAWVFRSVAHSVSVLNSTMNRRSGSFHCCSDAL